MDVVLERWLTWVVAMSWQIALLVGIVSVIAWLSWRASPRWRYALWLLVVLRVFIPPALTAPWSIGHWLVAPVAERLGDTHWDRIVGTWRSVGDETGDVLRPTEGMQQQRLQPLSVTRWLFGIWIAGCLLFVAMVVGNLIVIRNVIHSSSVIDEGPIRVSLERLALAMGMTQIPDIVATDQIRSPLLCGVLRPIIVLPQCALSTLSETDLDAILTHELAHWRRRDTWTGWLLVIAQGLLWFHPLMWWANRQLRNERERACDDEVLQLAEITPQAYGESLVHVLTATRGPSRFAGNFVGILERGVQLQIRLEAIMNFQPNKRPFGTMATLAYAAIAIVVIPMGIGNHGPHIATAQQHAEAAPPRGDTPYPTIVKSIPESGQTDVDPNLKEISVTFDRDMDSGMSWTGGPPEFPATTGLQAPSWTDARTCVLPVKLERGQFYRVGINSNSHQNFRSKDETPLPPTVILFTTQGAN